MADKKKDNEGFRLSGAPDVRSEVEKSRGADEMVTVEPLTASFRIGNKMYHPGDTEVPKSLAAALSLTSKQKLPASNLLAEAPEPTGGPDVKEAQEQLRSQAAGPAGAKAR